MIFVDTGAWVARFSRRDQYHNRAAETWAKLRADSFGVVPNRLFKKVPACRQSWRNDRDGCEVLWVASD